MSVSARTPQVAQRHASRDTFPRRIASSMNAAERIGRSAAATRSIWSKMLPATCAASDGDH